MEQTNDTPKQVEFNGIRIVPSIKKTYDDSPMVEEESDDEEVYSQEPSQQYESIALRKGKRAIRQSACYANMVTSASLIVIDNIPTTYNEAIQSSE